MAYYHINPFYSKIWSAEANLIFKNFKRNAVCRNDENDNGASDVDESAEGVPVQDIDF